MTKRIALFFLSALLLLGGFPLSAAAEAADSADRIPIDSREAFAAIADNPDGDYLLTADLNFDGEPWTPIPFSGTLDGGGHTIYNLRVREPGAEVVTTYDGNRKQYDTVFGGLFSAVTDAEITNLNLVNADVQVETAENCFIAALAGYVQNTTISYCSVQTRVWLTLSGTNEGVGGIVGFSDESWFSDCSVDCELTFIDTNEAVDCEEFMGGVFSCGTGRVERCEVKLRGFAEIYGYAHGGGAIGMIKTRLNSKFHSRLARTASDTEIAFFEVAPSKRCYCDPYVGENCGEDCYLSGNRTLHFQKQVSQTAKRIRPDLCESPVYDCVVTEPTCSAWGYSTFTCQTCGYTYTDDWTPPAHKFETTVTKATCQQEGETVSRCVCCGETVSETLPITDHTTEWIVVQEPAVGVPGLEASRCTVCGTIFETRELDPLPAPEPEQSVTVEQLAVEPTSSAPEASVSVETTALPAPAAPDEPAPLGWWEWIVQYILFGWLWNK
ncbi:MAG: hypothetical protein IJP98_06430 [Clostridia bacterium]|nr:hypothetical protein [Clostridia bacterium]